MTLKVKIMALKSELLDQIQSWDEKGYNYEKQGP